MAPKYRQLHAKTLDSFDFNEMPDDFTRVCWLLLPLIVDSEGRGINSAAWIRSKMFPLRPDILLEQIQDAFSWFNNRKMIIIYEVEGRSYFYIPKWKTYQSGTEKEAKSALPISQELVESKSGVKEELREVPASALYCIEDDVESVDSIEDDKFSKTQRIIESITGLMPSGEAGIKAIDDIIKMGAIEEDIKAAAEWIASQGKTIKYYSSLVGPTQTAMARRVQKLGIKKTPVFHLDNLDAMKARGVFDD